jgi:hypothetical protein
MGFDREGPIAREKVAVPKCERPLCFVREKMLNLALRPRIEKSRFLS